MVSELSELMQEKLAVIKEHHVIEYKKYPWYDHTAKKLSTIGRWSYPNVKALSTPDGTVKLEWEIDSQTVKALERRALIQAVEFSIGARGKFPSKYEAV